jgi:hypothetical protein
MKWLSICLLLTGCAHRTAEFGEFEMRIPRQATIKSLTGVHQDLCYEVHGSENGDNEVVMACILPQDDSKIAHEKINRNGITWDRWLYSMSDGRSCEYRRADFDRGEMWILQVCSHTGFPWHWVEEALDSVRAR